MGLRNWLEKKNREDTVSLKPCPECESDSMVPEGLFTSRNVECTNCGYETRGKEVRKSFGEIRAAQKQAKNPDGYEDEDVSLLVQQSDGESVTEGNLRKGIDVMNDKSILDMLDEGERPHHILYGREIDVESGGDSSSLFGNNRSRNTGLTSVDPTDFSTVITDKRIFTVVPEMTGNDVKNIPYDSITGVDLDTGLVRKRLTLQTHGRTYHISATHSDRDECYAAMKYIRQQRDKANSQSEHEKSSAVQDDPLDRLGKLQDLREKGVLTEEEFEEKKRDLLDQV